MTETTDIIKALKYWNTERFKTLQRKLTAAKNTIQNDALSVQFKQFFSDDEVKTLAEASRIRVKPRKPQNVALIAVVLGWRGL